MPVLISMGTCIPTNAFCLRAGFVAGQQTTLFWGMEFDGVMPFNFIKGQVVLSAMFRQVFATTRKGQAFMPMSEKDTYKYELRKCIKVIYVGITNDLERREVENKINGMDFTCIVQIDRRTTSEAASVLSKFDAKIHKKIDNLTYLFFHHAKRNVFFFTIGEKIVFLQPENSDEPSIIST